MMKYLLFAFVAAFLSGCTKKEEVKAMPKEDIKEKTASSKNLEMYEMSEMAALMEQMYADNQRLRERIKNNDTIGQFPSHFLEIHKRAMTDEKENDVFFKEQAAVFIEAQEQIYQDPKNAKAHFNKAVSACIACHEVKCSGPIPRIKKLYIE
ncbi:MAG TPA: hypothetical protein VFR70_05770 [Flavobacterium sp.]|nr:hypothetical protein [Flavobacterium sp.]